MDVRNRVVLWYPWALRGLLGEARLSHWELVGAGEGASPDCGHCARTRVLRPGGSARGKGSLGLQADVWRGRVMGLSRFWSHSVNSSCCLRFTYIWVFYLTFNIFFIYIFFGCAKSLLLGKLSLAVTSRGYSTCGAWASHCSGFSCYGAQALGAWAQQLRRPDYKA